VMVDAAIEMMMMTVYICFERIGGGWSCQLLIARAALADPNGTIPKNELQAMCSGSNLGWSIEKALDDWVVSKIMCTDSTIALHWVMAENKPLAMFHKNRVLQIRRGTETEMIYHVRTEVNCSDVGTRPDLVTVEDVQPGSVFQQGHDWMRMDVSDAEEAGYITHASKIHITKEDSDEYDKGLIFQGIPEILTRGHLCHMITPDRVDRMSERAAVADYLILPTEHSFPRTVRVYSLIFSFVTKCRQGRKILSQLLMEGKLSFQMFHTNLPDSDDTDGCEQPRTGTGRPVLTALAMRIGFNGEDDPSLLSVFNKELFRSNAVRTRFGQTQELRNQQQPAVNTDRYISQALLYLYRKGTLEVKAFHSAKEVKRMGYEVEGVLLSRDRLIQGMDFLETAEVQLDLGAMGIKTSVPVLDKYSPLSMSVARYIHWDVAHHKGAETCSRLALEQVKILEGGGLFRELGEQCIRCKIKRKRYLEAAFGPIKEIQLTLAPPFYFCQMDLFGPIKVFVPGKERETRHGKPSEAAKAWILTFVCPTTRLINMQVVETSLADGIVSGVIRLSCEIGVPKKLYIDQDSAAMCGLDNVEFNMRNMQLKLDRQHGIQFATCPVAGHNAHGHVERVIRSVQESLGDAGLGLKRFHATALQTLAKLVENSYNSLPLGYHQHERAGGTPVLKMITPNHLRMGRLNNRVLDGPMRLPRNREEQLQNVRETYDAWFRIWKDVYVPQLLFQPKWFRSDRDLLAGDLVYFIKRDSALDNKWTMGMVEDVQTGRDGVLREVRIKYCNASEQKLTLEGDASGDRTMSRYTERSVRKIVKIFSVEDSSLEDDLAELKKKMKAMPRDFIDDEMLAGMASTVAPEKCTLKNSRIGQCCCQEHCKIQSKFHYNLHYDLEQDDPVLRAMVTGEFLEADWEEPDVDHWDVDTPWDTNKELLDVLGIGPV
jgi:hypothetical protein